MQYSNFIMKNNVHATLSTALSSVATTIQLTAGQGTRFGTEFPQIATLESFDENGKVIKREIVKITGRSGDNLTVVRAFAPCPENDDANSQTQNAISFNADDTISLYIPKEIFDKIADSLNDIYDNGTNNMRTELVSGLQVQVNPGNVMVGSAYYDFAGGTITLTDNATNYLEIDEDGLLANNTTGRNDENAKLAIITTSSGSVTNIKDRRLGTIGGKIGGVNIHDLTEKTILSPNDEFIISDSQNIFQNKKVKLSNILPASIIRLVTLGEAVTAGNGQGACYFGTDGKVYLSNVAGHNYCDGIVIDSGSAGDTVRMIVSGFVPDNSLNGTLGSVYLAYTSTTENTGYLDYASYTGVITTNPRMYLGTLISIDGVASGLAKFNNQSGGTRPFIHPFYGLAGSTVSNYGQSQGLQVHYVSGIAGQYNNLSSYGISGCEIGKVVSGGFIFDPKPVEYMTGFGHIFAGSGTNLNLPTTGVLSNFDGEKTFGIAAGGNVAYSIEIQESPDNTNRSVIDCIQSGPFGSSQLTNGGYNGTSKIKVRKGFYYRYEGGSGSYQISGLIGIVSQR